MSNYFYRMLKLREVNESVALLNSVSDDVFPDVLRGQETFKFHAPDGDLVFSGLLKNANVYICRFHKEVFYE